MRLRAVTPVRLQIRRHPFIRFIGASRQKTDLATGLHAGITTTALLAALHHH
ncbi:hypothetical protein ABIF44_004897 [Bradyrhizobium japonicum]